jgi:putative SOS response-associated peptidase YedK
MCGRFTLHTPESRLKEVFNLDQSESLGLKPRYNISPSQQVPIIRDTDTRREMVMTKY